MSRFRHAFVYASIVLCLSRPTAGLGAPAAGGNPLGLVPDHATASVADLDHEAAWYERVLGFREVGRHVEADWALRRLAIPGYRIDLVWQRGSARPPGSSTSAVQGWFHVVFRTHDFEASYRRLVEQGTDVRKSPIPSSPAQRLLFHDPEGNELEIVSDQPPPTN